MTYPAQRETDDHVVEGDGALELARNHLESALETDDDAVRTYHIRSALQEVEIERKGQVE